MKISPSDSLLARVDPSQVRSTPFPHIVIREAIREDLCLQLMATYPPLELICQDQSQGNNQRFSRSAVSVLPSFSFAQVWRDFVELHISRGFWQQFASLFQTEIRARYPALEQRRGPLESWRVGVRKLHHQREADVFVDAQICVNSPVLQAPSSVLRAPHVDKPDKLFAGLFYLRAPDDRSPGGDLQLWRFRDGPAGFVGSYVDERYVEVVDTIPYTSNVLVLFLNSERAVHGVTPRSPTPKPRRLFNLLAQVDEPLFSLKEYQTDGARVPDQRRGA